MPHFQRALPEQDTVLCNRKVWDETTTHILEHGDGPIPRDRHIACNSVLFTMFSPGPPYSPITYNDTYAVLLGFTTKMHREGYWNWMAHVFRTGGQLELGDAGFDVH